MPIKETFKNPKECGREMKNNRSSFILCHTKYRGKPVQKYYVVKKCASFNDALSDKPDIDSESSFPENAALFVLKQENSWWLFNQNSRTSCSVNGSLIAPFNKMCLNDGDCIQWGLSEWYIHAEQPDECTEQDETKAMASAIALEYEAVKMEAVDLQWFNAVTENGQAENPFDLIMPEHPAYALPASTPGNEGILGHLYNEYIDLLNMPDMPSGSTTPLLHQSQSDITPSSQGTSLLSLATGTNSLETLQDLVTGSLDINQIFEGLDSLRESELFTPQPSPEILQLFSSRTTPGSSPRHQPPELTKKEHHALSVDSHYQMGLSGSNAKD